MSNPNPKTSSSQRDARTGLSAFKLKIKVASLSSPGIRNVLREYEDGNRTEAHVSTGHYVLILGEAKL